MKLVPKHQVALCAAVVLFAAIALCGVMSKNSRVAGAHSIAPTTVPALKSPNSTSTIPPVPRKAEYWAKMIEWGVYLKSWLQQNNNPPGDAGLGQVYYDTELCAYQLLDQTGDAATWQSFASLAEAAYRDYYVLPNNGQASGFRMFTEGLVEDHLRTGDVTSKQAALLLLQNGAYSSTNATGDDPAPTELSRECAYALMNHIQYARISGVTLTQAQIARREQLLNWSLGHVDQWAVAHTAPYFRPFMAGITARSLIEYYLRVTPDPRIIPKLKLLADYTWNTCWVPGAKALKYTDRVVNNPADTDPAPDLNLMIAPLYGFLWWQTGEQKWRDYGDQIWDGSISVYTDSGCADGAGCQVSGAYLGGRSPGSVSGKQYNQQLTWGPKYIEWAERTPLDANDLLVLHFDNSLTGEQGEIPTQSTGVTFAPGISGQGIQIDGSDILRYATAGNFNATTGSIEFWIKPLWNGNDNVTHFFFSVGGGELILGKDGGNNFRFIFKQDDSEAFQGYNFSNWAANQWHHIAVTWSIPGMMKTYLDGSLIIELL